MDISTFLTALICTDVLIRACGEHVGESPRIADSINTPSHLNNSTQVTLILALNSASPDPSSQLR